MRIYWLLTCLTVCLAAQAQTADKDSLRRAYLNEKTDTGRIIDLYRISNDYQEFRPDTALLIGQQAYLMAKKIHFLQGEYGALNSMAGALGRMGNYPKALEYCFEVIKIEEERQVPREIAVTNINISVLYNDQHDEEKALVYAKLADSIITVNNISDLKLYSYLNIGEFYEKLNEIDSALLYDNKTYTLAIKENDTVMISAALNNMGNAYAKTNEIASAFKYYRAALPLLEALQDQNSVCEASLGLAGLFNRTKNLDSAEYYAKKCLQVANAYHFQKWVVNAAGFLTGYYKNINKIDSAFAYVQLEGAVKDSIYGTEKTKEVQLLALNEHLRQNEVNAQRAQESKERVEKLQLLAIGIVIPIFFLISIFLSRRKVHRGIIRFSGVISLLMLFEYLTLLLHPFVAEKTDHSPVLEIIIFVAIAAIITPTHHRLEHWLMERLTHLSAAIKNVPVPAADDAGDDNDNNDALQVLA